VYTGWNDYGSVYAYLRAFLSFPVGGLRTTVTSLLRADLTLCQLAASDTWGDAFATIGDVNLQVLDFGSSLGADDFSRAADCIGVCATDGVVFSSSAASASSNALRTKEVTTDVRRILTETSRAAFQFRLKQERAQFALPPPQEVSATRFYSGNASDLPCITTTSRLPRLTLTYEWLGDAI
jgi:hypothetical protein